MKILCVGSMPNRAGVSGLQLAFATFVGHMRARGYAVSVVDTTRLARNLNPGRLSPTRAAEVLGAIFSALLRMPASDRVYLTLSSSGLGFLRDCILIHGAALLRRPVVGHLHGGGYDAFRARCSPAALRAVKATLDRLESVVVLGERLRSQFDFLDDSGPTVRVVPNGLPTGIEDPGPARARTPVALDGPLRLLYLSNLVPSKGYLDLVDACEILVRGGMKLECHLCGAFVSTVADGEDGGDARDELAARLQRPALKGRVTLHGTVSGEEKRALLESSHLMVLPTYYPWEGQPLAIIEGLAYGLPIISTEHRGIPEQLLDGFNGYFCRPRDPASLAQAIRRAWKGEVGYPELRRNARRHYEAHFTRQVHLRRLEAAVTGTAGDGAAG